MSKLKHSDESLMLAYAKGDIGSFEILYRRHKDALYRYMVRQVSDKELAHDLYQECWGRMIKSAATYAPDAKWSTWAYRIAHNLVVDHFRSVKSVHDEFQEEDAASATMTHAPDQLHAQHKLGEQLNNCLAKLPVLQREVFILSQETDLTLAMISEVVLASHEAVKTRLRYARSALQNCLAKFGLGPTGTAHDSGKYS